MTQLTKLQPDEITKLENTFNEYITTKTSSALSTLFSEPILHKVKILDDGICNIKETKIPDDEIKMCGISLNGKGDTHIEICYTIKIKHAKKIASKLLDQPIEELDELSTSAIQEVANIMTGSFFNAMASCTGFRVELSTPDFAKGELSSLVSVCAKNITNPIDTVVITDIELAGEQSGTKIHMMILQDIHHIRELLKHQNSKNSVEKHEEEYFIGGQNSELDSLVEDALKEDNHAS